MSEPFHVYGFRSAFTDWAANEGFSDAVQAAYRRTTYLGTSGQPGARVKLMEAWGQYCAGS